jgi:phosphopantetheine--protein transferase-like protein
MDEPVSCGIDIEEISRFSKFITFPDTVEPFISSVFTPEEIKYSLAFGNLLPFALGFSCKEAVFKAFGISWTNSEIKWQDAELYFPEKGNINVYEIRLNGFARKLFDQKGYTMFESEFEYTDEYVVFKVMLLKIPLSHD